MSYQQGLGVARDESKALQWHAKAAAQDNVHAQFELGMLFSLTREFFPLKILCCV
jgi:TPR repeat protein